MEPGGATWGWCPCSQRGCGAAGGDAGRAGSDVLEGEEFSWGPRDSKVWVGTPGCWFVPGLFFFPSFSLSLFLCPAHLFPTRQF